MTFKQILISGAFISAAVLLSSAAVVSAVQKKQHDASTSGREVTILVTAHPHSQRMRDAASKLRPEDFSVREDKTLQHIISVKHAAEMPTVAAVLFQDDLVSRINNELSRTKEFIRGLPEGSKVMVGYLTAGSLQVRQDFTTDRARAADSLRVLRSSAGSAPYNPYVEVIEALRRFDSQPEGRRIILLVSDGLDTSHGFRSASPTLSGDLDRAISEAQRRGVAVFSFYAPTVGLTSQSHLATNFGQGSLIRLADETGGETFMTGSDSVSFDPYFKGLEELLKFQWVVTYDSSTIGKSFRNIDVTTEQDVHLHYPNGYRPK